MSAAHELQHAPELLPVQVHPLKGGVDKPRAADEAKVPFSAEKRDILSLGEAGFINKQERTDLNSNAVALPDGSPLGLPKAVGFVRSQAKPAGGRSSLFTDELVEKLCLMLSLGFSRNQAAAYLKIDKSSISRAAARDPDLAAELRRAEDMRDMQPQITWLAEAQKNWVAAAAYLEFRAAHPLPLSEEEKEERHQAELAERRRKAELAAVSPKRRRRKVRGK